MANQNYQQTEMDLRTNLQQDVDCRVASVIDDTYDMLKDYNPPRWNRQRQKMMVLKKPNPPTLKPTMKNK